MKAGKVVLIVLGVIVGLMGLGLAAGGSVMSLAYATQRDHAGYFETSSERFKTASFAITSENIDLGASPGNHEWIPSDFATVRLRVERAGGGPVFVGIARQRDVDRFLGASAHDEIRDIDFDPFHVTYGHTPGAESPGDPMSQDFWEAVGSGELTPVVAGRGTQSLVWNVQSGNWAVIVMNADGSRGVTFDASIGAKADWFLPLALGLLGGGVVFLAGGVVMLIFGVKGAKRTAEPPPTWPALPASASTTASPSWPAEPPTTP